MTITRDDILAVIKEGKLLDDVSQLRDDIPLPEQGIDSLGMFNLLFLLDEKHKINIPDSDIDSLVTINGIITYLNAKVSQ